MNHISHLAN